jgi:hypothetical protein
MEVKRITRVPDKAFHCEKRMVSFCHRWKVEDELSCGIWGK